MCYQKRRTYFKLQRFHTEKFKMSNNSCTIGNKMTDGCNKLTYCQKTGVRKIGEYKYEEKLLVEARTGLNLCDATGYLLQPQ